MQTLICTFSSLIQTILSVPESHRFGCKKQFTDYTVGREYASSAAPCPEEFLFLFTPLLYALYSGLSTVFCDIFGLFDIFLIFLYKMPLDVFWHQVAYFVSNLSPNCHQIVTKSHRINLLLCIYHPQSLHLHAYSFIVQMIIHIICNP